MTPKYANYKPSIRQKSRKRRKKQSSNSMPIRRRGYSMETPLMLRTANTYVLVMKGEDFSNKSSIAILIRMES